MYTTSVSVGAGNSKCMVISPIEIIERMASVSAVVIFSRSTCCMCLAAKSLFCALGVSPIVHEIDRDPRGKDLEWALSAMLRGGKAAVPAVFVGGKLVGAMDSVLGSHINGDLVPRLKHAGALWL